MCCVFQRLRKIGSLDKHGFDWVLSQISFYLNIKGMFIDKCYSDGGMIKFYVMTNKPNISDMNNHSTYWFDSSNLWHVRIRHVIFDTLKWLIKLEHIPYIHIESKYKWNTCDESKLTRQSFTSIARTAKPLRLIHTYVCMYVFYMKLNPLKGGNTYLITLLMIALNFVVLIYL